MVLKDGFGGATRWPRRARNFLILSVSFVVLQVDFSSSKNLHYSWKTGPWDRCKADECGSSGVQSRSVWCVHSEGWHTHHSNCLHAVRPSTQRPCFKVCEWHQDLFQWDVSEWSSCSLAINSNQLRSQPMASECVTAQHGVQVRSVRCIRTLNGTAISERICEFFSPRPPQDQACLIPCPLDCIVSDFSAWSRCSGTCGVGLRHRTRHVLAEPAYGGAACPNLSETRPCKHTLPCPMGENGKHYSLRVGQWSECRLPQQQDMGKNGRTMLDFGVRERNVVKRHAQSGKYHRTYHRHQRRHLGQEQEHENLLQEHHQQQHDAFKAWSLEIGYQTRQVRCKSSDGRNAMMSLCTQDDAPEFFRSCLMPTTCLTSDWSSWSSCSKTCQSSDLSPGYRVRSRTITQPAIGQGKECPSLEEKEACNIIGELLPKCPRYEWKSSDWAECRVAPLLSPQEQRSVNFSALCGGGIQTREIYCVQLQQQNTTQHRKDVSRPVSAGLCDDAEVPSSVRPCSLPCSRSCLLSSWSSWTRCLPEDCADSQGTKGVYLLISHRQRRRKVLNVFENTMDCPHLAEFMPCEDAVCFQWMVQDEGFCTPTKGICGSGRRNQTVTCITAQGKQMGTELCKETPPPAEVSCEMACPGDCVISSWSEWSSCSQSCSKKNVEGRQSRSRSVLALPGEGGKACPPALALEEWRPCSANPCVVLYWSASPWSPCVSQDKSNFSNETSDCTAGLQTRKITCMKNNGGSVPDKRCPDSARPKSVRPCVLPCKRDCVVTVFSEWTSCPTTCMHANATIATQSRYRTIIQQAAGGGQECPDTLFEERECEALPVCPTYRWVTQKWQGCTLIPESIRKGMMGAGESCGRGLEMRALSCVDDEDLQVAVSNCVQWAGPMPSQVQTCWVPCKDDCTFSTWSKFTDCSGCGSQRTRRRSLTGRSRKRERCLNDGVYPLVESEPCVCNEFVSEPWGSWSVCILPYVLPSVSLHGWRGEKVVRECGEGKRYRAVACLNQRGRLLDPSHCSESELQEEVCFVPCPLDCRLSPWSPWTPCSASHGSGMRIRSQWLREKPFNGGRPCPKLDLKNRVIEAVPCRSWSGVYRWVTEPWSFCSINTVDKVSSCGEGVQSRKIRCVSHGDGINESRNVNDSLCDQDDIPTQARTCVLSCPEDCVMSPWTSWSSCPMLCNRSSVRMRSRQIFRHSSNRAVCPERNETEPCSINSNCYSYNYNASDWSSCILSEDALCGEGTKTRLLDCIRSDGKVMDLSVCEELGLSQTWTLSETCLVDCPISCILSEWTAWTECSHTCGNSGVMTRSRHMLQEAHAEGRPCPSQLSHTKPCPIRPCYSWVLGDWSPCHVEGADCGEGVRQRNLSCVVHWGHWPESAGPKPDVPGPVMVVEEEKCSDGFRTDREQELLQPCFVPCPGDCHLTDWSPWSSCQLTCVDGRSFEVEGHQARSRAVIIQTLENQEGCPSQEIETRPCKGGTCQSYEWRTSLWTNNEREVWCQRSDGVNVTGGCFMMNKPAVVRHCHPPCTKPFSHCKQSGVCGCEKGYTEVMNTHGFLDYCTRTPGGDTRKADVKSSSGQLKPGRSQNHDIFSEWSLQALGPDGRIKMWVYGATAGAFILLLFIISMSFLFCSRPVTQSKNSPPLQKALSLAYDGDVDM